MKLNSIAVQFDNSNYHDLKVLTIAITIYNFFMNILALKFFLNATK